MTIDLIDTARSIGIRLAQDAIWDGERCNWFSPVYEQFGGRYCQGTGTLGVCVYDGTAGIALFFGQLFRYTEDSVFARTAIGAIEHALSRTMDVPKQVELGFYTGLFGVGFAALQVGRCVRRPDLSTRGLALIRRATELEIDGRFVLDVMSGYAGTIAPLLSMYAGSGEKWLLDAAVRAGEALLARAKTSERGISWDTGAELAQMVEMMAVPSGLAQQIKPGCTQPHLTGLSHGCGGIAWALLELGNATGNFALLKAAQGAIAYEDSWFDAGSDQWLDLRHHPCGQAGSESASVAWCHGASGIGLTRLAAWQTTKDERYRQSLEAALRISSRSIIKRLAQQNYAVPNLAPQNVAQDNYSLCHGLAGDAELFINFAQATGDASATELVRAVAQNGQLHYERTQRPWPSGVEDRKECPGLMLGLAGTGYFYLRAADPMRTPSLLLLASR